MEAKKNIAKGDSYRLAYGMINSAISHVFPLQAIAVEESIISDRLWATLHDVKCRGGKHETTGLALRKWSELQKDGLCLFDESMESLHVDLSCRLESRNKILHGIVKSEHGKAATISAGKFDAAAMRVAKKGKELADLVVNWSHKQNRKLLD